MSAISFYQNVYERKSLKSFMIDEILHDIKDGRWQNEFLRVSAEKNKEERTELKKKVPCFTGSGTFNDGREDKDIRDHSGFIICDIDEVDNINETKTILSNDKYVYAVFTSISGKGVCFVVKIDGKKHAEAFDGLMEYYYNNYELRIDTSCRNVSRLRFVSFDPFLYHNPSSEKFKEYVVRPKISKKESSYLFVGSQFEKIIQNITSDICGSYTGWFEVGCAIASKYGEGGLKYFEHISQYRQSSKRKFAEVEVSKQYRYCCASHYGYTMSTFYHYAKLGGYEIRDREIDLIAKTAYYAKDRGNGNVESIFIQLKTILPEDTRLIETEQKEVIQAVLDDPKYRPEGVKKENDVDIFTDVILYLRLNYKLTRNEITKFIENDGQVFEESDMNSLYIDLKKQFPKIRYEDLLRIINSNETVTINPLKEYLKKIIWDGHDHLFKLTKSIKTDTADLEWRSRMLKRWFIGMVENIHGGNCPLMLVLTGKQLTGKTSFFNQILPTELKKYYGESQLNTGGTDDKLLMTQKLIIYDDEFSGKSKQDSRVMKLLLSSKIFSMRAPYARKNMDFIRLAMLCGTANEDEVLNDPTGNRRLIVFKCLEMMDWDLYNDINKEQLLAQAFHLYETGHTSMISKEDKDVMDNQTFTKHYETTMEAELINKYFKPCLPKEGSFYTASDMLVYIKAETRENTLYIQRFGRELRRLKFSREYKDNKYGYWAIKLELDLKAKDERSAPTNYTEPKRSKSFEEDLPF